MLQGKPYDLRESRIKDLPFGHRSLTVTWRKRRYRCPEVKCPARVFTETSEQIPPRHRLTGRLRAKLEDAASRSARSCADVAREYGVSDCSVHKSLLGKAISLIREPHQVRRLGLDETRTRSVRWVPGDAGWRRTDAWMTSFVDLDTEHAGGLLGLIPGCSGAAVDAWLGQQSAGAPRVGDDLGNYGW